MGVPILLISDLDDTLKISHTQSKFVTVYRGLFRSSAFAGMTELYQELLTNSESRFYVVSSSPPAIRNKILRFFTKHNFPLPVLILRDWIRQPSVVKYKMKNILSLCDKSAMPIILVGDDTEYDPEVFSHVQKKFPEKVAAIYIRRVKGRTLPTSCTGFFTAFDIACAELAAHRIESRQVLRVGEALLNAQKSSRLFPWFSILPPLNFVPFLTRPDEAVVELWEKIKIKIESLPGQKRKK